MAVGAIAGLFFSTIAVGLESPIHITGDEEIKLAVVVIVKKSGAGAPSTARDSGAFGDIRERAVSVVMIERVAAVTRYINIFKAVVIVIAYRYAHIVVVLWHSSETRLFRDIGKRAIGILMIKPVPELAVGLVGQFVIRHGVVDLGTVGEEDV